MAIELHEVNRIAKLARLTFNDAEKQKLQQDMSAILDYVDQLKQMEGKTENASPEKDLTTNLMRDDVAVLSKEPEEFLAQAPERQGSFIKVKSVLE